MKALKDQRGLTLIELLVVIVILGIIAAIAVVSIGGIMENSRKDAHIANAQQIVNASKLYFSAEYPSEDEVKLTTLIADGYLTQIKDPTTGENYDAEEVEVSYDGEIYTIKLEGYYDGSINEFNRDSFDDDANI